MKTNLKKNIMLLSAAIIWGGAFVAQSVGMDYVEPFTFNAVRCIIAFLTLVVAVIAIDKIHGKKISLWGTDDLRERKTLIIGGIICGVLLAISSNFQQVGIKFTTVGRAGFITALYIVFVPLLGLFFKKKVTWLLWIAVTLATVGFYFLCVTDGFAVSVGDMLVLACAFCFSLQVLAIDYFAPKVDCVRLTALQFFVCGALTTLIMFLFEKPSAESLVTAYIPLLYAGVLSGGVAFTFQTVGQNGNNPTVASLLMSLESVFAVIFAWLILNQTMTGREVIGASLTFIAIIIAQIPLKSKKPISPLDTEKTE